VLNLCVEFILNKYTQTDNEELPAAPNLICGRNTTKKGFPSFEGTPRHVSTLRPVPYSQSTERRAVSSSFANEGPGVNAGFNLSGTKLPASKLTDAIPHDAGILSTFPNTLKTNVGLQE
jgi:hypothetical protein